MQLQVGYLCLPDPSPPYLVIRRQLVTCPAWPSRQCSNMSLHTPCPFVPLLPPEYVSPEVHFKLTRALHADRGIHIVCSAGEVHARERIREAHAVVGKEHGAERKRVTQPDGVSRDDACEEWGVVATAVGVFEELAEVIQVQACTETVPAWETPGRIWPTCRALWDDAYA